ncbi:hypothetical protein CQA63_02885 [Helicobacter marmotae]|uniref:Uncharacterized protein n=1 Tax=Helicobacter marmotae TaxID=152490 RepID=A0A3D8I7K7_9HELI|nr:hypothetical protein CQA63_02885 [Helicobacter marmotae]
MFLVQDYNHFSQNKSSYLPIFGHFLLFYFPLYKDKYELKVIHNTSCIFSHKYKTLNAISFFFITLLHKPIQTQ